MPRIIHEDTEQGSLHLPRILCLHGGGTNRVIFRAQCRVLRAQLRDKFRLVFADAPFPSQPGPDVVSVYREFGPFRRWLRSGPEHPRFNPKGAVAMVDESLINAMREDNLKGADGEFVGILGFSQGAKMAASICLRQQIRAVKLGEEYAGTAFRFAVLMAGRGPLVSLDPDLFMNDALIDASEINLSRVPDEESLVDQEHILRLPSIHIHGSRDPGLDLHRQLLDQYCDKASSTLIEWDGNHRVPIKTKDIAVLVSEITRVAKETGVWSQ